MSRPEFTARRKALGLTQNDVARGIGMTKGAFSRVVNGERPAPRAWTRVRKFFTKIERQRHRKAKNGQAA